MKNGFDTGCARKIILWLLPTWRRPSELSVLYLHLLEMKIALSGSTLSKALSSVSFSYFNHVHYTVKYIILLLSIRLITCSLNIWNKIQLLKLKTLKGVFGKNNTLQIKYSLRRHLTQKCLAVMRVKLIQFFLSLYTMLLLPQTPFKMSRPFTKTLNYIRSDIKLQRYKVWQNRVCDHIIAHLFCEKKSFVYSSWYW